MTRYLGYIAMSLDGRIADRDGGVGWLEEIGPADGGGGYDAFYAEVDALVMGRSTYDQVLGFGDWPYPGKPSYVVTSRPLDARPDVIAVPTDFAALRTRIEAADHGTVWIVGGGATLRGALDAGMLDHLRVFILPVVLGGGPLLFTDGTTHRLDLDAIREAGSGMVETAYAIRRTAA